MGFVSRCKGSAAGGGVCYAVGSRLCVYKSRARKAGEAERNYADFPLQGTAVCFGCVYLVDAHAVAYEIEHVLGLGLCE